ncbi:hypothetical protein C8J56DRAFT_1054089 [Mycena floridula]|nr:hypothetical protein C8J56DRAFT_1054089 [Mycena floridula]
MLDVLQEQQFIRLKTLTPVEWLIIPSVADLCTLSEVKTAFEAETSDITEATFSHLELPSLIANSLGITKRSSRWKSSRTISLHLTQQLLLDLNLFSIWLPPSFPVQPDTVKGKRPSFHGMVVTLAGLDPSLATPSDMDQLETRYICEKCTESPRRRRRHPFGDFQVVFNWRGGISHGIDSKEHQKLRLVTKEDKLQLIPI